MGIDIWEVVDAAATKPFGFMRFSPGPGLGGHCIPVDPFYLTWKAREFGFYTEFIELAGKVNEEMPYFCRSLVSQALEPPRADGDEGLADPRARRLVQAGHRRRARVARAEAHLAAAERRRRRLVPRPARAAHPRGGLELSSVAYEPGAYDCVVIVTDHSVARLRPLVDEASLVVDLRNATGVKGTAAEHVFKL